MSYYMRQYSWKFWILFWVVAGVFLTGWFFFWQWKRQGLEGLNPLVSVLPVDQTTKTDMQTLTKVADAVMQKDGRERVYLLLLQNSTELRPGGGYIGSFAILKIRDGVVTDFAVHDTNLFDAREPNTLEPPYPMRETLKVGSWQMRDSNWSPDFPTNALKAEEMYHLGQGEEQFDAVIGVTTNTLVSVLRLTGDITLPEYNKTFTADTVVDDLEYQVEQQWWKDGQGIGERKQAIRALGDAILARVKTLGLGDKKILFETVLADLHQKDIQVFFKDATIQDEISAAGWSARGQVVRTHPAMGVERATLKVVWRQGKEGGKINPAFFASLFVLRWEISGIFILLGRTRLMILCLRSLTNGIFSQSGRRRRQEKRSSEVRWSPPNA